eukprot:481646-Rhodomonas_salina.2
MDPENQHARVSAGLARACRQIAEFTDEEGRKHAPDGVVPYLGAAEPLSAGTRPVQRYAVSKTGRAKFVREESEPEGADHIKQCPKGVFTPAVPGSDMSKLASHSA